MNAKLQVAFGEAYMGTPAERKKTLRRRYPDIKPDEACNAFDLARQRHEGAWIERFIDSSDDLLRSAAEAQRVRLRRNADRAAQRAITTADPVNESEKTL